MELESNNDPVCPRKVDKGSRELCAEILSLLRFRPWNTWNF